MLTLWSKDIVLCTNGPANLSNHERNRIEAQGIAVREELIAQLEGRDGQLEKIVFANGDVLARRAMFFNTGEYQSSTLLAKLGCELDEKGRASTGHFEESNVDGVYVVGDASGDIQLVVVAAAEGARAAVAINKAFLRNAGLL